MGWDEILKVWDGMGHKFEWDGNGMGWDEILKVWDGMG